MSDRIIRTTVAGLTSALAAGLAGLPLASPAAATIPGLVVVSAASASNTVGYKSAGVDCPASKKVVGTGFEIIGGSGEVVIGGASPLPDLSRVNVWAKEDRTAYAGAWSVTAYAFCADPPPGLQLASGSTAPRSSASPQSVQATCPPGTRVLGTGFGITDGVWDPGEVALAHLVPDDTAVYARGYELDPTSATWYLTVHAICADPLPGLERVTATSAFNTVDGKSVTAFCPDGKRATGLGATTSLGHRGVIDDLRPNDGPSTNTAPPPTSGKATGYVDENVDTLEWWIASYAICATASATPQ